MFQTLAENVAVNSGSASAGNSVTPVVTVHPAQVSVGQGSMKTQAGKPGVEDYTDSRKLSIGRGAA